MKLTYRFGGKTAPRRELKTSSDHLVLRTESNQLPTETAMSVKAGKVLSQLTPVFSLQHVGVQVFAGPARSLGSAKSVLSKEKNVRFAGNSLRDPRSNNVVLYSENVFVKFGQDVAESKRRQLLSKYGLTIKRSVEYAPGAYFTEAVEGIGQKVFPLASSLLDEPEVELCHPEILRRRALRAALPQQWHLKKTTIDLKVINAHANVEAAWTVALGAGITISVIDDGFDRTHEEFLAAGKVVSPRDVTRGTNDPAPGTGDRHGHACSGVACADGLHGASGVAPKARLLPIRLASALGSQDEADAFVWAADHGADVISCSWGPEDGNPTDPSDPLHQEIVALPDSTRLAIDHAAVAGRGGKGCVVLFAAGNGNESVDNDGYASYEKVIAVAACDDTGKRSFYSDKGKALWCAFPSSAGVPSLTPGIWTTDLPGARGYNNGDPKKGDALGNYTNRFGGTSSAAPGAAGVAALVLSKNPSLTAVQVRDILKRCCDRIDTSKGKYDAKGHSKLYGFGRLNAAKAVGLA